MKSANQPTIKHDYKFNNFGLIKHQGFTYRESETRDEKLLFSYTPLQKLLFSATLTRNPGKLASLKLIDPKLISISNSNKLFTVPETLIEHVLIVKDIQKKPLALLDLLNKKSLSSVLIFAKSVQAAHRLSALLNAYFKSESSKPYSSNLLPFQKKNLLLKFKSNEIKYLVCSDVMSRGMDLGESVTTIINYDVASNVETFIHRIGRTARANRDGTAYSILEAGQKKWFMNEMKNVSRSKDIIELVVDQCVFNGMMERYIGALKVVGKMVKGLEQESNVLKVESDDMDSDPEDVLEEDNTISHEILENVENDVELEDDDETEDDDHGSEHDDEEEDRKDQIDDMVEDQAVDAESKKRKRGSALDEFLKT